MSDTALQTSPAGVVPSVTELNQDGAVVVPTQDFAQAASTSSTSKLAIPQTPVITISNQPPTLVNEATAAPPVMPTPPPMPSASSPPPPPGQRSLIDILVQQGSLTKEKADALLLQQAATGENLEKIILDQHLVPEESLTQARAQLYNVPFVKLEDFGVSPEAISLVPESVARRYHLMPFAVNKPDRQLSIAMVDPLDLSAIDFVEKQTGFHILPFFASAGQVEKMIAERYSQNLSSEVTEALEETKFGKKQSELQDLSALSKEVVREAPINKIVETILAYAMKSRASDVHIEPQEDRTRVRYRIDGILAEKLILPKSVHDAVLSRIKILAGMKIDEKRLPQDGRFTFSADGEEVDLRISTLPTVHGEKVVMRLLKKNASVPTMAELGLRGKALRDLEEAIKIPHGIILITGPTGSGKTTTLYSILHQINTPKVNISTLEDPVEYQVPGVNQVQINQQVGITFASGLRAFLRQDPNIIMVGEIRDRETTDLAIQASLTGHLVFSTVHTNSAAGAMPRLIDLGAEPFLLASTLTLTMGQRVLRCLNPDFKEEYTPDQVMIDDIKKVLGPLFDSWCSQNKKDPNKVTLFRTKEERPAGEPEYEGRMAIFEVLRVTDEVSRMILEQKSAAEIEKTAIGHGMLLMKQDGYIKALEGLTTIEEVLRVAEV